MDKEVARFCWLWHSYFNNWPVLCLVSIQIVEQVVWQMCPVYGPAIWQSTYILGAKLIFYCILWRIYFFFEKNILETGSCCTGKWRIFLHFQEYQFLLMWFPQQLIFLDFSFLRFPCKTSTSRTFGFLSNKCNFWGMSSGTLLLYFKIHKNVFLAYNTTWKGKWTRDDNIS